jgi:uncharacterized membrane protein
LVQSRAVPRAGEMVVSTVEQKVERLAAWWAHKMVLLLVAQMVVTLVDTLEFWKVVLMVVQKVGLKAGPMGEKLVASTVVHLVGM